MTAGVHISIFVMAVFQFIFIVPMNIFIAWDCWCLGDLFYALVGSALSTIGAAISIHALRLLIDPRQAIFRYPKGEKKQHSGSSSSLNESQHEQQC
ncbi:hypothetical protein ACMYSK_07565 [Klebsiella sp. I138]|uniref:hypothetical protein n=1 Tax=Klebsiella sp. I138 TaxID=2755385 RepID=UPI003DA8D5E9